MLLARFRPYGYALLLGSLAGWLWSAVLVDFEPRWYLGLQPYQQLAILIAPVVFGVVHAGAAQWWDLRVHIVYALVIMSWWIAGSIHNELRHAGSLQHMIPWSCCLMYLSGALLLMVSWCLGRLARRYIGGHRFPRGAGMT